MSVSASSTDSATQYATIRLFQTVWVVGSAVLQGILLMSLRTRKIAYIQSRPSKILFRGVAASILLLIGFVFIPLPISWYMPLSMMPNILSPYEGLYLLLFLVAVWGTAIVILELAKHFYVRYSKDFL
jgi:Mg2+-importing ATPase